MHESHEGCDGFFASQGDSAESFEFVEEALDLVALFVEPPVDGWAFGTAGVGFDLGGCAKVIGDKGA